MVLNCFLVSLLSWCKVTDGFEWRDVHSLCQNLGKYLEKNAQESWGGQEGVRESSKNILMAKFDLLGLCHTGVVGLRWLRLWGRCQAGI